ncbi:MAG: CDP-archaeol synthase [Deltaproteobacteria bacterium]|nr:CDP-archaeol synthase [Deltaproteobacteria bacterium]
MILFLLQALFFAAPVVVGGLVHIAVIKLRLLAPLARVPLDGGLSLRGRRLFGDNKTLRGALVMITATALACWGFSFVGLGSALPVVVEQRDQPLWWGALLGTGYILGELPNSFLKRQLDTAPGAPAPAGAPRVFFWVLDQIDCLIGVAVVVAVAGHPLPWSIVATLLGVTLVLHPLLAGLMVLLGLKSRVG